MKPSHRSATTLIEGLLVVCLGLAAITLVTEMLRFFSTRSAKTTARDAQAREGTLLMDRLRRTLKLAVEVIPTDNGLRIVHYARVDGVLRLVATSIEDLGRGRVVIAREDGTSRREFEVGALDESLVASLGSGRVFGIATEQRAGEADRIRITLRVAGGDLELVSQASSLARGEGLVAHRPPRPPSEMEAELLGGVATPPWPGLPAPRVDPTEFEAQDAPDDATAVPGAEPTDGDIDEETEPEEPPDSEDSGATGGDLPEDEELPDPEDATQAERQTAQLARALEQAFQVRWQASLEHLDARHHRLAAAAAVEALDGFVGDPAARVSELKDEIARLKQEIEAAQARRNLTPGEIQALDQAGRHGDEAAAEEFAAQHLANHTGEVSPLRNARRAAKLELDFMERLAAGKEGVAEEAANRLVEARAAEASARATSKAALNRALSILGQATAQARAWGELDPDATSPGDVVRRLGEMDGAARPLLRKNGPANAPSRWLAVDSASLANSLGS